MIDSAVTSGYSVMAATLLAVGPAIPEKSRHKPLQAVFLCASLSLSFMSGWVGARNGGRIREFRYCNPSSPGTMHAIVLPGESLKFTRFT
jgi:hypothetical protein